MLTLLSFLVGTVLSVQCVSLNDDKKEHQPPAVQKPQTPAHHEQPKADPKHEQPKAEPRHEQSKHGQRHDQPRHDQGGHRVHPEGFHGRHGPAASQFREGHHFIGNHRVLCPRDNDFWTTVRGCPHHRVRHGSRWYTMYLYEGCWYYQDRYNYDCCICDNRYYYFDDGCNCWCNIP